MPLQSTIDTKPPKTTQADGANCTKRMQAELSEFLSHHIDDPTVGWPRLPRRCDRNHDPRDHRSMYNTQSPQRERRVVNLRIPTNINPWGTIAPLRPLSHSPTSPPAPPGRPALPDSRGADPPGGSFVATAAGDEFHLPGKWWVRFLQALRDTLRYVARWTHRRRGAARLKPAVSLQWKHGP